MAVLIGSPRAEVKNDEMRPGERYRLQTPLTAIRHEQHEARVMRLNAGTLVTVAARIADSQFVQVTVDMYLYEVLIDDLIEAGSLDLAPQ